MRVELGFPRSGFSTSWRRTALKFPSIIPSPLFDSSPPLQTVFFLILISLNLQFSLCVSTIVCLYRTFSFHTSCTEYALNTIFTQPFSDPDSITARFNRPAHICLSKDGRGNQILPALVLYRVVGPGDEGLLIYLYLQLLVGRGLNSKLAEVLSLER